jgi:type II secretory pathway pseudopilin PulG
MPSRPQCRNFAEEGFLLMGVLVLVLVLSISLAIAAPKIAQEMQRDKEAEYYHRGQQYARAIRLFYNKTGHYPTDIAQLEKTDEIRFLRKRYRDPITGSSNWRLIHQGEAKSQLMGLFGQPYAGQIPGASTPAPLIGNVPANGPTANTGSTGSGSFGNNSGFGGAGNFGGGNSPVASTGGSGFSSGGGFSSGSGFSMGSGFSSTSSSSNSSPNANQPGNGNQGASNGGLSFGGTNPATTFGGAIVGVSSTSKKESIRVYRKQTHYDQWEFVYNPAEDGIGGGSQPGMNTPGIVSGPSTGAPSGVNVNAGLPLPPPMAPQTPPTPPPSE